MTRQRINRGFGQESVVVDAFFETMTKHKLDFFPTGSRHMGGWTFASDWDFIMFDSPEARAVLDKLGFVDTFSEGYTGDKYTSGHMTCTEPEPYEHGQLAAPRETKIQVQLTPRVDILLGARDVIATHLFSEHLKAEPERRHELWDAVMKVLDWKADPSAAPAAPLEPEEMDIETVMEEMTENYPFAPENF